MCILRVLQSESNLTSTSCTSLKCRYQKTDGAPVLFVIWFFLVLSTSVRHALVIHWTSVCIVLYCSVQYVEIYIKQRAFTVSIFFLFLFKENYCWIILITSRSLWQPYFITRYMWTIVLANCFDRKTILFVWWDQRGVVYYELVKTWGDGWY